MKRLFLLPLILFACVASAGTLTLTPEGPGTYTDLSPSPSPPNWANVVGPLDYNFASNNDQQGVLLTDTYTMSDPGGKPEGTITNVRVVFVVENPGSGFSTNKAYATLLVDGQLFVGPENNNPPSSSTTFYYDWPLNPCTDATWKWHEIRPQGQGFEAGGRLYAIGNPFTEGSHIRLMQSYVEVTFE